MRALKQSFLILILALLLGACSPNVVISPSPAVTAAPAATRTPVVKAGTAATAASAAAPGAIPPTGSLSRLALAQALRGGGYVIFFRHGLTNPTPADASPVVLGDCSTQRMLSAAGRAQAQAIGQNFARLGIPVGKVLSSPYCRTLDTAQLAFHKAQSEPALENLLLAASPARRETLVAGLRQLLAAPPVPGANTILVSHGFNLQAATQVSIAEGEAAIFLPDGKGSFTLVATVPAEEWATFEDKK